MSIKTGDRYTVCHVFQHKGCLYTGYSYAPQPQLNL